MADQVKTPSDNPNQPAVETPAAVVPPTAAVATPPADPTVTPAASETPAAPAAPVDPAAPAAVTPPETPKPTEAAADAAKPPEPQAATPETYDIQLPKVMLDQGLQVDPALIPALTPALKKAGMTQQQLQTVAESFMEYQAKIPALLLERDLAVTMKDPELGGLNYGRTQGHVNAALTVFTTPEFRTLLGKTGLANNLEFVRVFERIGKALGGDSAARGSPDGAPALSRAERMYGKTAPNT